jgi:DNA-binding response OmpR family regulator
VRKILIVEDEEILRDSYEMILSTQPYQVDVAENGKVALEKCQNTTYDLILLDIMMPVMSGVEFLKHFMSDAPSKTRLIMLSNLSSGEELEATVKLGVSRNALKSDLSPKQLLALVRYEIDAS